MLAAEIVATRAAKNLDFGDWGGDEPIKVWSRRVRRLLGGRDMDADAELIDETVEGFVEEPPESGSDAEMQPEEPNAHPTMSQRPTFTTPASGYDSDDSLTGYASEGGSSRSASPTPSEREAIDKDPSLIAGKKKILRPVYLLQLGHMLRRMGDHKNAEPAEEADSLQMALDCAEELIRRKAAYGSELGVFVSGGRRTSADIALNLNRGECG